MTGGRQRQATPGRPGDASGPPRWPAFTLALILVVAIGGCAGRLGIGVRPPEVSVADVSLARPGLLSQELVVRLAVRNRMTRDLVLDSVAFDLDVAGGRLASGVLLRQATLAAEQTTTVDVPVTVRTEDLLATLGRVGRTQAFTYRLKGRVHLGGADAGESVRFDDEGRLDLRAAIGG